MTDGQFAMAVVDVEARPLASAGPSLARLDAALCPVAGHARVAPISGVAFVTTCIAPASKLGRTDITVC